mgnify:CR=1 FL=1
MYEVTIIKSFSAAHLLAQVGGKCEELHGHNFKVELSVGAAELNSPFVESAIARADDQEANILVNREEFDALQRDLDQALEHTQ